MKVREAITILQNDYNPDDVIVIAWWGHDGMEDTVPKSEWDDYAEYVSGKFDWSTTHEDLVAGYEEYANERT